MFVKSLINGIPVLSSVSRPPPAGSSGSPSDMPSQDDRVYYLIIQKSSAGGGAGAIRFRNTSLTLTHAALFRVLLHAAFLLALVLA